MMVSKPTDQRIVDLLVAAGFRVEVWTLPAECRELHCGPTISIDDLLDFYTEIEYGNEDKIFAELASLMM